MLRLFRLLATGLGLLLLTGCATVQLNLRVEPNGTGVREMILAIDKEALRAMAAAGRDPLQEVQSELEREPGVTMTRYEAGSHIGFKAVAPFAGSVDLQARSWNGRFTSQDHLFWRDYRLALDADLDLTGSPLSTALLGDVDFSVSVQLPTQVAAHNGQADPSGRKITWTLVPGRREHLTLQARQCHPDRIAGAVAGLGAILAAAGFLLFRQKKP